MTEYSDTLICDNCGRHIAITDMSLPKSQRLWDQLVTAHNGKRVCPECYLTLEGKDFLGLAELNAYRKSLHSRTMRR